jgi:flagellar basal body-associated protein FliL
MWCVRSTVLVLAISAVAADEDDDDDDGGGSSNLQSFVDTNPSINSTELSACGAGTFGVFGALAADSAEVPAAECSDCPEGRTTEVWSLELPGALGCTIPGDDEDGEDSDDWVPSLAACKSTCVGTCPGIVWTEPAGPTSCLKCTAETEWSVPSGPLVQVHKRISDGATLERHCDFCTDGLTLVDGECKKTGVCSTIGPVPYFKASGKRHLTCLPCPAQEDVGTAPQIILVLLMIAGAGGGIWTTSAAAAEQAEQVSAVGVAINPESCLILLPTFQFVATAFSFDFSWPSAVRTMGTVLKTVVVGSFSSAASPECYFSYGAWKDDDRYLSVLGLQFSVFMLFALIFGGIVAATGSHQAVSALCAAYSVFLVLIASACFTSINITELPDGNYALDTLPSITSQTDDFGALVAYGVCGLLLFLCVIPGLIFMLLKKASDSGTLWSEETQARFGSLFLKYRAECWWYEVAIMGRKILLAAIAILSGSAITSLLLSAIVIGGAIAVQLKYKPYQSVGHKVTIDEDGKATHGEDTEDYNATGDQLELLCMGTLLFVYLLGGLSASMEPEDGTGGAIIITILAVLVLLFPVGGAIFIQKQGASADGENKIEETVSPVSEGENEKAGAASDDEEKADADADPDADN